jgi:hypothetical protein
MKGTLRNANHSRTIQSQKKRRFAMKKLVILTLCVGLLVFGTQAFADELLCGRMNVTYINLWESDPGNDVPIAPCDLWFNFAPESGQGPWLLPAEAFGTQLNLALLKSFNWDEEVSVCLWVIIDPPNEFSIRIRNIDFGFLP